MEAKPTTQQNEPETVNAVQKKETVATKKFLPIPKVSAPTSNNVNALTQKKIAVSEELKRAVDWKIFEISSLLIDRNVDGIDFEESLKWFQPKHAEEVIEERTCEGLCGYPLCKGSLTPSKLSHAKYRIDYKEKKVFEVEKSILYCSPECLEKTEIWVKHLDMALPYGRPVVKCLNLHEYKKTTITDVLDLISTAEEVANAAKEEKKSNSAPKTNPKATAGKSKSINPPERAEDAPPIYYNPTIGDRGNVKNVEFQNGRPIIRTDKVYEEDNDEEQDSGEIKNQPPVPPEGEKASTEQKESAETVKAPLPPPNPFIPKKVVPQKRENPIPKSTPDASIEVNKPVIDKEQDDDHSDMKEDVDVEREYPLPKTNQKQPVKTEVSVTIEEIMKTMRDLQFKHGLMPAAPNDLSSSVIIGGSKKSNKKSEEDPKKADLWNEMSKSQDVKDPSSNLPGIALSPKKSNDSPNLTPVKPSLSSDSHDTDGTSDPSNKGKKKKTVEWNIPDEVKQPIPPNHSLASSSNVLPPSPSNPQPQGSSLKQNLLSKSSSVSPSQKKPLLAMSVVEKPAAAPMSVKAILTKKEPPVALPLKSQDASYYSQHIEGHYYQPQQSIPLQYQQEQQILGAVGKKAFYYENEEDVDLEGDEDP